VAPCFASYAHSCRMTSPYLLASRLLPIPGPSGGGRLIAISEVWYRRAALCALAAFPEAGSTLKPLQIEVGVSCGSQLVSHTLRASIAAEAGCVAVQIDWKNTYNTLCRVQMLMAVNTRCPSLLPFGAWAYRQQAAGCTSAGRRALWCLPNLGFARGTLLGSLLFALTLQDPLEKVAATRYATLFRGDLWQPWEVGGRVSWHAGCQNGGSRRCEQIQLCCRSVTGA
jgi:hypothetical protein